MDLICLQMSPIFLILLEMNFFLVFSVRPNKSPTRLLEKAKK